jgi:hypothetical protein
MRKLMVGVALGLSFIAGAIYAGQVRDWHDLDDVHKHVVESLHELERARAANHYDMQGHGIKAEEHLRQAEHELQLATEAARVR